jgi:WD40 repeat protein
VLATSLTFSPDGAWLVTGDGWGDVRVWEMGTQRLLHMLHVTLGAEITSVRTAHPRIDFLVFAPDSSRLLVNSYGQSGQLQLWEVRQPGPQLDRKAMVPVSDVAFSLRCSPDGHVFAIGSYETDAVQLIEAQSLRAVAHLEVVDDIDSDVAKDIAFSPDGRWLAVAGAAGTVFIWDVASQRLLSRFAAHRDGYDYRATLGDWALGAMDWSPAGNLIATSGLSHATNFDAATRQFTGPDDYTIKLWEVQTDAPARSGKAG